MIVTKTKRLLLPWHCSGNSKALATPVFNADNDLFAYMDYELQVNLRKMEEVCFCAAL
jgi:hypothetical protein